MGSRNTAPVAAINRGVVVIAGSFAPNGSSAVAASSVKGRGFTVARSNTGLFVVTFTDKWKELLSATGGIQLASAGDQVLQFGDYDASASTIEIRVWDISGPGVADIAADTNNRINFCFVFQASNLESRGN